MKFKKIILISILLLSILTLSTANATSLNENSHNNTDQTINEKTNTQDKIIKNSDNENTIQEENTNVNNWDELTTAIDNKKTSITLKGEDTYDVSSTSKILNIKSSTTINGNGRTITGAKNLNKLITINSKVTIKNIIFKDCQTTELIHSYNDLTIINCTFTNNNVAIHADTKLTITNSTFNNNKVVINFNGPLATIKNTKFINNNANHGGAINSKESTKNSQIELDNCIFTGNTAKYGGAIYSNKTSLKITNSKFNNNTAKYGGAINIIGHKPQTNTETKLNIINTEITNNNAETGGAIYADYIPELNIINSQITNNNAKYSGAINAYKITLNTNNSQYINNNDKKQIGISISGSSNIIIKDSYFQNTKIHKSPNTKITTTNSNAEYNLDNLEEPKPKTINKQTKPKPKKVKLTLKKIKKLSKKAKKLVLQATIKIDGKKSKGKIVTFKFNGKKYTTKTNKKGVAKITITKKILKKLKVGKKVKYQALYTYKENQKTITKTAKKSIKVNK